MAEYIGKYENAAAIQSAVDGGELIKPYVALDENTGMIDWNSKSETDWSTIPFTVELMSSTKNNVSVWSDTSLYYKINDGEWTLLNKALNLTSGNSYSFKGTSNYPSTKKFFTNLNQNLGQELKMYGNIMSLISGDNYVTATNMSDKKFMRIFKVDSSQGTVNYGKPKIDITNLVLPATTLAKSCYQEMFSGSGAYSTKPVILPATTLANSCYYDMFSNCTNLNYIKCLATDISASNCTWNWLSGVASTGTFVKAAGVTWPSGISGIPNKWTVVEE